MEIGLTCNKGKIKEKKKYQVKGRGDTTVAWIGMKNEKEHLHAKACVQVWQEEFCSGNI